MNVPRQHDPGWRPKPIPELERVRRMKGLSQRALARLVGVNSSHLCRIEYRDLPASEWLREAIADSLETDVSLLFDEDGKAR